MKTTLLTYLLLPAAFLHAEEISVPQIFFESDTPKQLENPAETRLDLPEHTAEPPAGASMEAQISQAVVAKDWAGLAVLLQTYRVQADADAVLIAYAEGARLRAQGQQAKAIEQYRNIASADLPYVQLDLALMLAEDKQYREAADILTQLEQADIAPSARKLASVYREAAEKAQSWQPSFHVNFEQTDNVNNASAERTIDWNGRQWRKTEDSLPKSAKGLRYGLGIERTKNIKGHHFVHVSVQGEGVHYRDAQDFNEQTVQLAAGYRWQDVRQDWGVVPFAEQNWLGGARYNHSIGVTADYRRRLNGQWQLAAYTQYSEKRYREADLAGRYDSRVTAAGITAGRRMDNNSLVYGGLDVLNDDTREREQASWRYGMRVGAVKQFSDGLGMRANLRYMRREFKAPGWLVYDFTRRDHEYHAAAEVWHSKLSWKGFTPQLNYRYAKIASNMKGFYSRKSSQWFVSVARSW